MNGPGGRGPYRHKGFKPDECRELHGEERERAIAEFLAWYRQRKEYVMEFEGSPIKEFLDSGKRVAFLRREGGWRPYVYVPPPSRKRRQW